MKELKAGEWIDTPRFCHVKIKEVFPDEKSAKQAGYKEPTHWNNPDYGCLGKSLDLYHMEFCAYRKGKTV